MANQEVASEVPVEDVSHEDLVRRVVELERVVKKLKSHRHKYWFRGHYESFLKKTERLKMK